MKKLLLQAAAAAMFVSAAGAAWADDIEGVIERVDVSERTLMVQGITFHTIASTDYDDGLKRFEDLREGQRVEVDFTYRDGRHFATEIELDD
ncbi:DUF5666 domain-containing protein [Pseudazoarcus pumilus]|uniref:DUF5666 domain-containing protein n=1 Tax=Pseudazoarcus pumilus TaxID=2067960 RepID=A0A2I6S3Z0_9RHOO|nr:DUF5666 domain-containing protein [Pseudazoarcus pumilus]AUN93976.1 hypothetical protein C0099_02830 [Pseudazoarcus pumilus]